MAGADDPTPEVVPARTAGPKDVVWALVGLVSGMLFVLDIIGAVVVLARGELAMLVNVAVALLVTYWFAAGAWRRTVWGRRRQPVASAGPPTLSTRTAAVYLYLLAACAIALVAALVAQIVLARTDRATRAGAVRRPEAGVRMRSTP